MSSMYKHLTPEAKIKRKRRNKTILYVTLMMGAAVLGASVTVLMNNM